MKKLHALLALALFAAAACGPTDPDDGKDPIDEKGKLYALMALVNTGGGQSQSYLVLTDDVTKKQALTLDDALELPGGGIVVGAPGSGQVFTSSSTSPTLTRFTLDENDELVQGDEISFAGQGVAKLSAYSSQFAFVSETKAYYFDDTNYKLVIWDPKAFAFTTTKDLTSELKYTVGEEVYPFTYAQTPPVRVGDALYIAGGWFSADRLTVPARTALVKVDTKTDAVTVLIDDRCGWARDAVLAEDGFIYLGSEAYAGGAHFLNADKAAPPCLIRFDPEAGAFDGDFFFTFDEIVNPDADGDIAGMLMPGGDGKAYLRVMDREAAEQAAPAAPIAASTGRWWLLWEITLGDTPVAKAVVRDDVEPVNGRTILQDTGDLIIAPEFIDDNARTALRILTNGLGTADTVVEGQVRSVARLR